VPNVDGGSDGFLGDDPVEGQAAPASPDSAPTGDKRGVTAAHMQPICAVIDTL
jgi:hypothetical protein